MFIKKTIKKEMSEKERTKNLKTIFTKLLAALTAFASVLLLGTTMVFAQNAGMIDPAAKGSITIHKFDQNGTFIGDSHDGTEILDTSDFGNPLAGIGFTIALMPGATNNTTVEEAFFDLGGIPAPNYIKATTDRNGLATFSNLEQGVYIVMEDANSGVTAVIAPFLISIPMTNPVDTSSWIYDIHVYPKNNVLDTSISKSLIDENGVPTNKTTADVGDTVEWRITPSIPANIASIDLANSGYFYITDTLDTRLDFVDISVVLVDHMGNSIHTFMDGTDVTLSATGEAGGEIKVDFNKQAGIEVLKTALLNSHTIRITIKTTINQTALENLSNSIVNTVSLDYRNDIDDPSVPITPLEPAPEVKLGGVALYKWYTDKIEGEKPLAGATFSIYASQADAENGTAIKLAGTDLKFETNADGYIYFSGKQLAEALGVTLAGDERFYLVENKAPNGFELVNKIIEAPLSTTASVENVKLSDGFVLPITGGMGTLLYTIVGIALIGTAVAIFGITKAKNRKNKKA